jgi:hypothetical protein
MIRQIEEFTGAFTSEHQDAEFFMMNAIAAQKT